MKGSILIVDDDDRVTEPLVKTLEQEGHTVRSVATGGEALDAVATSSVEVVILDLDLPDMDGLDLCRSLRHDGFAHAVFVTSDRNSELDRVFALDSGADDYLTRPFGLAELQARVRALLRGTRRRAVTQHDDTELRVDVPGRRAFAGAEPIPLTGKEFDVLAVLFAEREKVVPRSRLMAEVWHTTWYGSTKTLDVTIGRLRGKLEAVDLTDRIIAVRGVGFRLEQAHSVALDH